MAFDVIIRAFFTDTNLSAGLAKANAGIRELGSSGTGARKGINLVQGGIQALAIDAAGAAGPIGRLAAGVLQFTGGAALTLGASAGIGLVALAWREMGKDADRAAGNAEAAAERIRKAMKSALSGGDTSLFGDRLDLFARRVEEARAELDRLMTAPLGPQRMAATPGGLVLQGTPEEDRANEIRAQITTFNQLQALFAQGQRGAGDAADKATAALERQGNVLEATVGIRQRANETGRAESAVMEQIAEVTARATAEEKGWDAARTAAFVTQSVRLVRLKEENAALEAQRDLISEIAQISADVSRFMAGDLQGVLQGIHVPSADEIFGRSKFGVGVDESVAQAFMGARKRADLDFASPLGKQGGAETAKAGVERGRPTGDGTRLSRELRVASESLGLIGALRQGGVGNIVGAGGGVLSSLGTLKGLGGLAPFGLAATAGGGLLNALTGNADKNADRIVKAIERREAAIFEQSASIIVIGPDGHATRRALAQLEDSDAVERIPGPVGARG